MLFASAYLTKFQEAEAAGRAGSESRSATPPLRIFNTAVRNILSGYAKTFATSGEVMEFLRAAYKPFGIDVTHVSGKHCLSATDIARFCGIYSETGRPHGHAAASIIDNLGIAPEHTAMIPYGMVGISMRYDAHVLEAVRNWLAENGYPNRIPHLYFYYHIYYKRQMSLFDAGDEDYYFDIVG
jgi:hypothetical protein